MSELQRYVNEDWLRRLHKLEEEIRQLRDYIRHTEDGAVWLDNFDMHAVGWGPTPDTPDEGQTKEDGA